MTLNWFFFADPEDVAARELYGQLVDAQFDGNDWTDTWVQAPVETHRYLAIAAYSDEVDYVWNAFEWVEAEVYQSREGNVFVRLLKDWEIAKKTNA